MNSTSKKFNTPLSLNADFDKQAVINSADLPWQDSPQQGVQRRYLDRVGGEVARATSVVKYAPDSHFPAHTHGAGEEFLVLKGTFRDEHGTYPEGSYIRNPPGSSHTPFTHGGCIIFVKLRQMQETDEKRVEINTGALPWEPMQFERCFRKTLLRNNFEHVCIERLDVGGEFSEVADGGAEIFLISGELVFQGENFGTGTWIRIPHGQPLSLNTATGVEFWIKRGHLPQ